MIELRVDRIANATPRVRTLQLVALDGAALAPFTAGSHIDVELGNGDERSYSLLNDQGETHRYVLGVLREAAGRGGSAWMHDVLREGDVLRASEPSNNFRLSEAGDHHILIAGGIGVTPILSMAARLAALGREFVVHYCARDPAEAAFADKLAERHGDRVHFHFDGGDPSRGLDVAALMKERATAGHAYVCGPAGLIRAVREAGRDWPVGTVHYELFKGGEEDVATRATDQPFDVVLKRSDRRFTIPAGRSILDVLKDNGVRVKALCREGVCGTCRIRVVSGAVEHRDDCLDDEDRDEAMQVCVSRAAPGVDVLVLDL